MVNYYLKLNTPVYICFLDIKSAYDRVSHWKLLSKLMERKVPMYLIKLIQFWLTEQKFYVRWSNKLSSAFTMTNGIRQGSILSPYLFNVFVDDLNSQLSSCKIGCHVGGEAINNFSYADDLAIVCPNAVAVNDMLRICEKFAKDNYVLFSNKKSKCMRLLNNGRNDEAPPNIYLNGRTLEYVKQFKYLGHIITEDFMDDEDIKREMRSLSIRGNILLRKFHSCDIAVKKELFRTFCYSCYCASLWSRFRVCTFLRIKVIYNNIMRRLAGVPQWESAREMFVGLRMYTLPELMRVKYYSLMRRVVKSENSVVVTLYRSDARKYSSIWERWNHDLFV